MHRARAHVKPFDRRREIRPDSALFDRKLMDRVECLFLSGGRDALGVNPRARAPMELPPPARS